MRLFLSFRRTRADVERMVLELVPNDLRRVASGIHATRETAEDYARREGPMVVLAPDGEVFEVERCRDVDDDVRTAVLEREYAERRRWLGAPREPNFRPM